MMKQKLIRFLGRRRVQVRRRMPYLTRRYPYTGTRRMLRSLGPVLSTPITWQDFDSDQPSSNGGDLQGMCLRSNAFKWKHYIPIYESLITSQKPIRFLEIGVLHGGSLRMWREYLHPESLVVGIDIDPSCQEYAAQGENLHVRIGSQSDSKFLEKLVAEFGQFDVIIDDGGHLSSLMTESFRHLFPFGLADNGIYIVEDLHASYLTAYRDRKQSFIDFISVLIDAMHAHYQTDWPPKVFEHPSGDTSRSVSVPRITPMLGSVEVFDSVAVVRKAARRIPTLDVTPL